MGSYGCGNCSHDCCCKCRRKTCNLCTRRYYVSGLSRKPCSDWRGHKNHAVCFPCRRTYKGRPDDVVYDDRAPVYRQLACPSCGGTCTPVPDSFRAPKSSNEEAWALVERLVKTGSIPEFSAARRGTLAWFWESSFGGLGCLQHTYEATWKQMWYPSHARELQEWIQFMMTTSVVPRHPPAYTKAARAAQAAAVGPYSDWWDDPPRARK